MNANFIAVRAVLPLVSWLRLHPKNSPPSAIQQELSWDMYTFAHGFFRAPPAEQTERVDIFREMSALYRRKGVSTHLYARAAAALDNELTAEERRLIQMVAKNFVTGC